MAMPSRKRLALILLISFLLIFITAIGWYLAPIFFGETYVNEDGTTERRFSLFPSEGTAPNNGGGILDIFGSDQEPDSVINQNVPDKKIPRLRKITDGPVIGATIFPAEMNVSPYSELGRNSTLNEKNTENIIRYIELGTGHVFEGSTNDLTVTRISNTTIPKIHEALFVNPDRILIRYADDFDVIKTFSAELVQDFAQTSGVSKKLQGIFLEDNMFGVSISPQGKLLYMRPENENGNVISMVVSDALGGSRRQVFASPLSEWRASWQGSETSAVVVSTPSYNTFGLAYTLDTQNGSFVPYTTGRLALDVLTNTQRTRVLMSLNNTEKPKLYIWKKDSNEYIDLGLSGYAEKCVWAANKNRFYCAVPVNTLGVAEPDLWYQGVTKNNDEIWEINPENGQSLLLVIPSGYTSQELDVIDLAITPDERYLYFREKQTRSLWSYQLDVFASDSENAQTGEVVTDEEFFE